MKRSSPIRIVHSAVILAAVVLLAANRGVCAGTPLNVFVVNYPLKYFAERIGGPHVKVSFPVPSGQDPAYWVPGTAVIGQYQQADLILLNGAGYAKWVRKVSLPRSKTVDTSLQVKGRYITAKEVTTHSHGPEGKHAHEALAFTTWLDFDLAAAQAEAVCRALISKRPELETAFRKACDGLVKDLKALDQSLLKVTKAAGRRPLVVSHPVYDYLGARYGLYIVSLHWEPDRVPDVTQIQELKAILKTHPARWMVWEGKPEKASVDMLEALGIKSLVFDPCGNVPREGDFMSVMRQNIENLKRVF